MRKGIAVLSSLLGTFLFVSQQSQPVSGIALLHQMEKESITVNVRIALDDVAAVRQSCIRNLLSLPLSLFPDRMLYVTESLRLSSSMLIGVRAVRPLLHQ